MSTTYGKWRLVLPPHKIAESLLSSKDLLLPEGGCDTLVKVVDVLNAYMADGYLDEETAHAILREWKKIAPASE